MTRCTRGWPFWLALSIAMTTAGARATTVVPQNLEQLESQAQLVFVGVCTSRTAEIDPQGIPVRTFTFEVAETVKGNLKTGSRIVVRHFGNDVPSPNGLATRIPGIPTYAVGQEVLLFLNPPSSIGLTAPVGLSQGLFRVERGAGGKRIIRLDPVRRNLLQSGINPAKYTTSTRFTPSDRERLSNLPEQIEVREFCSLIRKVKEEREQAQK